MFVFTQKDKEANMAKKFFISPMLLDDWIEPGEDSDDDSDVVYPTPGEGEDSGDGSAHGGL